MRYCGILLLICAAATFAHARPLSALWLAGRRVTPASHVICLPASPTPSERTAAEELRLHVQLITGRTLEIVPEARRGARHGFFIGRSAVHPLPPGTQAALGDEGLIIRSIGQDLLLAGNRRGVLYAVSVLLEEHLGVRWLAPDCTLLPRARTLRINALDRRVAPRLAYRYTDYDHINRNPRFAMRLRINSDQYHPGNACEEYGGYVRFHPFCHSFGSLVPAATYFDAHPEYFSLVDGERRRDHTQLCLTNPDVLRIAKAQVRRWIAEQPDARYIDISINDYWEDSACQCAACRALDAHEDSRAGPLIHFLNALADDITDEFPDTLLSTLAYNYVQRPPRYVRPRPNVAIRVCSYHCSFSHPLNTDDYRDSRQFRDDLRGWAKITSHLLVWDYTVNFAYALAPFPNLDVLQPNLRLFLDHGVEGVYEQGCYYTAGSEMAELRAYLIGKLLWNPETDVPRAIREFTDGYYGPAAPYLRQYLALAQERVRRDGALKIGVGTTYGSRDGIITNAPQDYLSADFLPRAQALFAQARRAAADHPTELARVRRAHLGVLSLLLQQKAQYTRRGGRLVESDVPGVDDWAAECRQVIGEARVTRAWEQGSIDELLSRLKRRPPTLRVVRLRTPSLTLEVLPEFGGEIMTLRGADGRNHVQCFGERGRMQPEDSGIKDFSDTAYNSPGWCEPFQVVNQSARSLTLRAALSNGLELERTITLAADRPAVRLRSVLRNLSDAPRGGRLRVHAVFAVADPARATLRWQVPDGRWQAVPLPGAGTGGDRRFIGNELPAAWGYTEAAGDFVCNRLLGGAVESAYCWVDWPGRWLTLELWSPRQILQPGETLSIEHEYRLEKINGRRTPADLMTPSKGQQS